MHCSSSLLFLSPLLCAYYSNGKLEDCDVGVHLFQNIFSKIRNDFAQRHNESGRNFEHQDTEICVSGEDMPRSF